MQFSNYVNKKNSYKTSKRSQLKTLKLMALKLLEAFFILNTFQYQKYVEVAPT